MYDVQSTSDVGTLYQARTFLNARNVPKEPMKNANACEELLSKYSDSLLIVAFQTYCNKNAINFQDEERDSETNPERFQKVV